MYNEIDTANTKENWTQLSRTLLAKNDRLFIDLYRDHAYFIYRDSNL